MPESGTMENAKEKVEKQGSNRYTKLGRLLDVATEQLRQLFRSRYKYLTNQNWVDDSECGKTFMRNLKNKGLLHKLTNPQSKLVKCCQLNDWDLTLLHFFLTSIEFEGHSVRSLKTSTQNQWIKENECISKLKDIRNDYAHLGKKSLEQSKFESLWTSAVEQMEKMNFFQSNKVSEIQKEDLNLNLQFPIEIEPIEKDERCEKGERFVERGDLSGAIELFSKALRDPNLSRKLRLIFYSKRSWAHECQIKSAENCDHAKYQEICHLALDDADKCVALAPTWWEGHYRRGNILRHRDFKLAMEAYNKALALNPSEEQIKIARDICISMSTNTSQRHLILINDFHRNRLRLLSDDSRYRFHQHKYGLDKEMKIMSPPLARKTIEKMMTNSNIKIVDLGRHYMGNLYSRGDNQADHVPLDYERAVELFKKASCGGIPGADVRLGQLYLEGKGVKENVNVAIKYFECVAEMKVKPEQDYVKYTIRSGVPSRRNKWALVGYKTSEQVGLAQYELAQLHLSGRGKRMDHDAAVMWFKKSYGNGNMHAAYMLGVIYENDEDEFVVTKDIRKAIEYFEKAAEDGLSTASFSLGLLYLRECDVVRARHWYSKALADGDINAKMSQQKFELDIKDLESQIEFVIPSTELTKESDADKMVKQDAEESIEHKEDYLLNTLVMTEEILQNHSDHGSEMAQFYLSAIKIFKNGTNLILEFENCSPKDVPNDVPDKIGWEMIKTKEIIQVFAQGLRLTKELFLKRNISYKIKSSLSKIVEIVFKNLKKSIPNQFDFEVEIDARIVYSSLLKSSILENLEFVKISKEKFPQEVYFHIQHIFLLQNPSIKRAREGIEEAQKSLGLFPDNLELLKSYNLALLRQLQQVPGTEPEDLIKCLHESCLSLTKKLLKSDPKLPEIWYLLSFLLGKEFENSIRKPKPFSNTEKEMEKQEKSFKKRLLRLHKKSTEYFENGTKVEKKSMFQALRQNEYLRSECQEFFKKSKQVVQTIMDDLEGRAKSDTGGEDADADDCQHGRYDDCKSTDSPSVNHFCAYRRSKFVINYRKCWAQVIKESVKPCWENKDIKVFASRLMNDHRDRLTFKQMCLKMIDPDESLVYNEHYLILTVMEDPLFGIVMGFDGATVVKDECGNYCLCMFENVNLGDVEWRENLAFGSKFIIRNPVFYRAQQIDTQLKFFQVEEMSLGHGGCLVVSKMSDLVFITKGKDKHICRYCGKDGACKLCGKCRRAKYCSRECQEKDWKLLKHKYVCHSNLSPYI